MAPGKKALGGKKMASRPPSVLPDPAATPSLPPTSKTLAPGKRTLGGKNTPSCRPRVLPDDAPTMEIPEEEDMDLSSLRARKIMRNNQFAHQLGVRRLAELFQSSFAKKKAVGRSIGKKSKALLLGADVGNTGDSIKGGTGRTSKRVLAPENPEETMRCTRQRTAREVSTTSQIEATEFGAEPEGDTNNTEQGNLTLSTEVEPIGLNNTEQGTLTGNLQVGPRGKSMGKEIDSISRGLGAPIEIIIKEGKRRPEAPMQAAKLASEAGILIRQHIPIYTNWTKYKKDGHQLKNLKGKLKGTFEIDIDSKPVTAACEDMLKGATRQMRHRLKKRYFDGVPANQVRTTSPLKCMTDEQWRELVDMWSSPEHKDKCAKNQLNRGKVQFQQRTGSRSYIAHAYVVRYGNTSIVQYKDNKR